MSENYSNEKLEIYNYFLSKLDIQGRDAPLSQQQLIIIEKQVGYKLPNFFRWLLLNIGASTLDLKGGPIANSFFEIILYGYTGNIKGHADFKPETLESIQIFYEEPYNFPRHILPFGWSYTSFSPYCFDLSEMKDGDCPVYEYIDDFCMWDANPNGKWEDREGGLRCKYPEKLADTFEEFITKFIDKTLDLYPI